MGTKIISGDVINVMAMIFWDSSVVYNMISQSDNISAPFSKVKVWSLSWRCIVCNCSDLFFILPHTRPQDLVFLYSSVIESIWWSGFILPHTRPQDLVFLYSSVIESIWWSGFILPHTRPQDLVFLYSSVIESIWWSGFILPHTRPQDLVFLYSSVIESIWWSGTLV